MTTPHQLNFENDFENEENSQLASPTLLEGVVVTDTDWTAETVISQVEKENIFLNPRFQRREAWDDRRKSKFIESLVLGLPVPQLVLAEMKTVRGKYMVIDGKQRLLSLIRFATNKFEKKLTLKGLEIRPDLNGKTWDDIKADPHFSDDVSAFENSSIRTTVIRGWKDERALYLIFHRLNSGSVTLSPQELRHVLHPGKFIDFAFEYCESSKALINLLGDKGRPDFRMRDVELLIRFFGLRLFLDSYNGDLKSFLDDTVELLNKSWATQEIQLKNIAQECEAAINFTFEVFEDNAFVKWTEKGPERRFNRAVFDVMTYYFQDEELRNYIQKNNIQNTINLAFQSLCIENSKFIKSVETTTKTNEAVITRLWLWGETLEKVIGIAIKDVTLLKNKAQRYGF